ncbi:MAG: choice-of-anchor tandem repeat GloVer-containing protein, partial [Candidatus Cybelea sp.]
MNTLTRRALTIGAAATLFAGCGGSQPLISASGTMQQSSRVPRSLSYEVLHRFSLRGHSGTSYPNGALIDINGMLYGTTYGRGGRDRGTVYSLSLTGEKRTFYRFHGPDGSYPRGALLSVGGTLYGTTTYGGATNDGVVFSVTTSGAETVLYSFKAGSDGANPYAGLIDVNGTLYGTTFAGGDTGCYSGRGCGTVYSISATGTETVLHSFSGGLSDGEAPYASLVDLNGTLYGTTYSGGPSNQGVVYTVTSSGMESILYRFGGGSDGAYPKANLVAAKGRLYGTTYYGGGHLNCRADPGCGTVFSITPKGEELVLY